MSFGFEAASFLKADTISYAPKAKDYLKCFRWGPGGREKGGGGRGTGGGLQDHVPKAEVYLKVGSRHHWVSQHRQAGPRHPRASRQAGRRAGTRHLQAGAQAGPGLLGICSQAGTRRPPLLAAPLRTPSLF